MSSPDPTIQRDRQRTRRGFHDGAGISYPNDLTSVDNEKAIKFTFSKYKKSSLDEFELKEKRGSISLMLPPELSHSDGLEYNDFDGGLEASALSGIESGIENYRTSTQKQITRSIQNAGAGIASAFGSTVASNGANIADVQTGRTLNPRVMSKFERVSFKTYQFTWVMIAKNESESRQIKNIVNKFRKNAHPELRGPFFEFPSVVEFTFLPDDLNDYLWKPEPCAITNVSVSYNSSGTPKFFKGSNAPVEVVLSVQLKELLVKTREDFE